MRVRCILDVLDAGMRFVYYDYEDGGLIFPLGRNRRRRFYVQETWLIRNLISSLVVSTSRLVMMTVI